MVTLTKLTPNSIQRKNAIQVIFIPKYEIHLSIKKDYMGESGKHIFLQLYKLPALQRTPIDWLIFAGVHLL
jgi:hypothetical protein